MSNIIIDTTKVATGTINYVDTDTWGNIPTSTRTLIIEAAPSIVPAAIQQCIATTTATTPQ